MEDPTFEDEFAKKLKETLIDNDPNIQAFINGMLEAGEPQEEIDEIVMGVIRPMLGKFAAAIVESALENGMEDMLVDGVRRERAQKAAEDRLILQALGE